ncbi:MAG: nucleotide exchange factor GrpE [Alcanivoracaceae bacterium]|nr:nucleotide exchange factor GrpE [Alcanivoracaceae bacterium]
MSDQEKGQVDEAVEGVVEPAVDATDAGEAPAPDLAAELAAVQEKLAATEKALSEADIRAQAEIQNMRRRLERDVSNAHKYALEKFSTDILAVADSLERGLVTLPADDEALKPAREGTELTLKVLLDIFGKYKIAQLNPVGEKFDPQQHEAMAMVPMPGAEPNAVIEVLEKGYALNERLIRPARVVVAKGDE